jgi:hypothetical protein
MPAAAFTSIGGENRHGLAAIDITGAATTWNPNPDTGAVALAVIGHTIYAAGPFTFDGGADRKRIRRRGLHDRVRHRARPEPRRTGAVPRDERQHRSMPAGRSGHSRVSRGIAPRRWRRRAAR